MPRTKPIKYPVTRIVIEVSEGRNIADDVEEVAGQMRYNPKCNGGETVEFPDQSQPLMRWSSKKVKTREPRV